MIDQMKGFSFPEGERAIMGKEEMQLYFGQQTRESLRIFVHMYDSRMNFKVGGEVSRARQLSGGCIMQKYVN